MPGTAPASGHILQVVHAICSLMCYLIAAGPSACSASLYDLAKVSVSLQHSMAKGLQVCAMRNRGEHVELG